MIGKGEINLLKYYVSGQEKKDLKEIGKKKTRKEYKNKLLHRELGEVMLLILYMELVKEF